MKAIRKCYSLFVYLFSMYNCFFFITKQNNIKNIIKNENKI